MSKSLKRIIIPIIALLAVVCLFAACNKTPAAEEKTTEIDFVKHTGGIGAFTLTTPAEGESVFYLPAFVWSEAQNADTYELEVCSSEGFSQTEDDVYVKKTGIVGTSVRLSSTIKEKNKNYYWRVTAVNDGERKKSAVGTFYLAADEKEIEFDVNYADEWEVHKDGSDAKITVDDSDFFGNGKNSLVVSFVEEDTKRGIPSSDGWIVVTHSQETEMYGVDAFFFNFYYSGNDADVYLRVVDEDNEYWHSQIKLANNARQTVIMKFDDFELRTKGGTTIANQVFDYNYIKYVELVFERSFGDGVAMISDLKAIKYDNYKNLFIDEFDFNSVDKSSLIHDHYNFDVETSEDGKSFTYAFSGSKNDKNDSGVNGYGFVKFPLEKLMVNGNAFTFDLSFTGNITSGTALIRIIEEDGDRWVYRQKLSQLGDGHLIVPYMAFTLSEYKGDGNRQFYYIKQLQLGMEGVNSTGSITIANLDITWLEDEVENLYRSEIDDNGVIDDFNGYGKNVELYYRWMLSDTNKDEVLTMEKSLAFGGGNTCVKLGYKADMGQAMYATMFDSPEKEYTALSLWAMDRSIKKDEAVFNYLEEVNAEMIISLFVSTGEEYRAPVINVSKYWTEYVVAFEDFTLAEGEASDITTPLKAENIVAVKLGFQYYYYAMVEGNKVPYPTYVSNNFVYIDNVKFTFAEESGERELMSKLLPEEDNPNVCVIEDFDDATSETLPINGEKGYAYEKAELSTETASGEGQSVELFYKGKEASPSYGLNMILDGSVSANCIKILMKGDGKATVYVNVFFVWADVTYKYRATLTAVSDEWTVYTIGFENFRKEEGTGNTVLSRKTVPDVNKITIGIVNSVDGEESSVIIDKMVFDGSVPDRQGGTTQMTAVPYEEGLI